ncbi:MAG: type II secretion system F family protein [Planctomycetales bacterium]|nr:type II secretion system F family protein [Planctomycetales bacterium]NIM09470.1 type II secretion system F family protein [Planctomycetales bacterium]NIN08958.1 type II secretion system F family protein [Planctomycetales bacterium]NIN78073.1 type II secretion system F family protein [Planctomycetales bacterium]NIO35251.1 type II secretion system F family protein [Planctomycetales bacterium]
METFAGQKPRAQQRLEDLKHGGRRRQTETAKEASKVSKVLEKTSSMAKPLAPTNEAEVSKQKQFLVQAGFRSETAPAIYNGCRFIGLIVGLFLCGGPVILMSGASQTTLLITGGVACALFYLPTLVVLLFTKHRQDGIFYGLPDALDLMVVCVEAGLGLDQAMRKVAEEMENNFPILAQEFSLANFQLQMGRSRNEVLQELASRTGVDDLRSLAAILIQADKFGSSIAQALRVQSDSMRTRRRQLAEEKAAKTAVKLIFPLVMFIFPGIFVVLVGPAAIQMVRELFTKMN